MESLKEILESEGLGGAVPLLVRYLEKELKVSEYVRNTYDAGSNGCSFFDGQVLAYSDILDDLGEDQDAVL